MSRVRHALVDFRLPIGGWLAWIAFILALVAWGYVVVWALADSATLWLVAFLAPFVLIAGVPVRYVRRRGFRPAALLCGALLAVGGFLLLWFGGLVFAPAGVVLLVATLFGGGRPV